MKLKSIFLISFLFVNPIFSEEGYYSLSYKMNSIVASIELNGIVLTEASQDGFKSGVSTDLNLWIMPGENILKIKLLKAYQKGKNISEPKIETYIRLGQAGQTSEEGKEIVKFIAPELEQEKIIFPIEKEIRFTPDFAPPSAFWNQAEEISLDEISKKEITKLIQSLHTAANSGNKKKFLSLIEFKMRDLTKAMLSPVDDKTSDEKATGEFLKMLKGKLVKIPNKLSFRLVANGKLVYVVDDKGNDIIRTKASKDDGSFSVPIYVGKINGKWILAR